MVKIVRARVIISGSVQGVFFREGIKREAEDLDLKGWAKNIENGEVEAILEGPENIVKEVIFYCQKGPKMAKVQSIKVEYEDPLGEDTFEIIY